MWRLCLCGECVYVEIVFMWRMCLCGECVYVSISQEKGHVSTEKAFVSTEIVRISMEKLDFCGEASYVVSYLYGEQVTLVSHRTNHLA